MMELIEHSRMAIDELIDVMGRASIEAVLELSARQVARPPQQGKARPSQIGWLGTQLAARGETGCFQAATIVI